jgi:hypothetical protein
MCAFPRDDALRHVGFAFGTSSSWGDVYPFSVFESYRTYDPWYGYDTALKAAATALSRLPLSPLTLKFLLIKALSLTLLLAFLYLALARSGIVREIRDRHAFTLALLVLLIFLTRSCLRAASARPCVFGSLFLLYAVGRKGVVRGAVSSAILVFLYPYLSWFVVLPVAFAHYVRGDRRFAWGAALVIVLFLLMQPPSFWGFVSALIGSDAARKAIVRQIGELRPALVHVHVYVLLAAVAILYPRFSQQARKLDYAHILILIYTVPALKHVRYFDDFVAPLAFVAFGAELLRVLHGPSLAVASAWRSLFRCAGDTTGAAHTTETGGTGMRRIALTLCVATGYLLLCTLVIYVNVRKHAFFHEYEKDLAPVPRNALALTTFNPQYTILFLRPDLRLIPSCEIGFHDPSISQEYTDLFNKGRPVALARKTGAQYFLEARNLYVDPRDGSALRLLSENKRLRVWQILDTQKQDRPVQE